MAKYSVEQTMRHFLMWVICFTFLGTMAELILLEHYEVTVQFIPYVLSVIGIISVLVARFNPKNSSLKFLRWVMVAVVVGSLVGIYFHFTDNMGYVQWKHPELVFSESLWSALKGHAPVFAPGILFLAGVLGISVTYKHPELRAEPTN